MPRVFANSILVRNAQEAVNRINASPKFDQKQKQNAIRIMKMLISSRSKQQGSDETPEARIDYIADNLGIVKEEVIEIVNLLRLENILADSKDLSAYIKKKENRNRSLAILSSFAQIEDFLLSVLKNEEAEYNIKELNEQAQVKGTKDISPDKINTILNHWAIKQWIIKKPQPFSKNHISIRPLYRTEELREKIARRCELAEFIIEYLTARSAVNTKTAEEAFLREI